MFRDYPNANFTIYFNDCINGQYRKSDGVAQVMEYIFNTATTTFAMF